MFTPSEPYRTAGGRDAKTPEFKRPFERIPPRVDAGINLLTDAVEKLLMIKSVAIFGFIASADHPIGRLSCAVAMAYNSQTQNSLARKVGVILSGSLGISPHLA